MSQKVNPTILRLGIKNEWFSKYFEKKSQELTTYSFNDLEIRKFIDLFFKNYGLTLIDYKLYYKKSSLHLFIIYDINILQFKYLFANKILIKKAKIKKLAFGFLKTFSKSNFRNASLTLDLVKLKNKHKLKKIKLKTFRTYLNFYKLLKNFFFKKIKATQIYKNSLKFRIYFEKKTYNDKTSCNKKLLKVKLKRLYFLKYHELLKNLKNINQHNFINLFTKKIFVGLSTFLKKKTHLTITLKQLNKNNSINISNIKKNNLSFIIMNLKKFENTSYFDSGINLLYNLAKNRTGLAYLISNYISIEFSKIKNPKFFNFFLKFIITSIKYFLLLEKTIKSLKINIKGNLGRKPRAFSKIFILGQKISNSTINTSLQYNESTCFSKKGTFGIKVWVIT